MSTARNTRTDGWFKSSYSGDPNGECVEANYQTAVPVVVRDSKQNGAVTQPILSFSADAWSAFTGHVGS